MSGGAGSAGSAAGAGGSAGAAPTTPVTSDDYAEDIAIEVHEDVNTILVVTWTQAMAADETWLEFSFEGSTVMTSRAQAGRGRRAPRRGARRAGRDRRHRARRSAGRASVEYKTRDYMGTTGAVPAGMPLPTVLAYDAALASPERWHVRRGRELGRRLHQPQSCYLPHGLLALHHGPPGPHRLVLRRRREQRDRRRSSASRATASTSGSRSARRRTRRRACIKMTLDREYFETIAVRRPRRLPSTSPTTAACSTT